MAEHGEIPSAWAGIAAAGTFFGGLLAVLFGRKKPDKEDDTMTIQRLARLEERADEQDRREHERVVWRDAIFGRLLDLDKKVSSILAIMDERRHG